MTRPKTLLLFLSFFPFYLILRGLVLIDDVLWQAKRSRPSDLLAWHRAGVSFLLRLLVQTVLHMEEGVLREYVAADFGAALTVEGVGDVG